MTDVRVPDEELDGRRIGSGQRAPLGPGRVLVWLYAVFVLAAGARSAVQLATDLHTATLAYALSAVAAGAYAIGLALVLRAERGAGRREAALWCVLELAAVVAIGTWTVAEPGAFSRPTVWSVYGRDYGFVPLALPVLVLAWLRWSPARAR